MKSDESQRATRTELEEAEPQSGLSESSEFETARKTIYITIMAILTALTTVVTSIFKIPYPYTEGYFNFGDIMVMTSGILLGPLGAFFAGGVGSAMADAIGGYLHYAPITLVVKGFEAMVVSLISRFRESGKKLHFLDVLALIAGAVVMLTGYFLAQSFLYGWGYALGELVLVNIPQVIGGIIAAAMIGPIVRGYLHQEVGKLEVAW